MIRLIFIIFLFLPLCVSAAQVHSITAETNRMDEDSLKKLFNLKEDEIFTEEKYEKAKEELEGSPLFKKVDFLYKEEKKGIDIHIKADDGIYIVPMAFAYGSNKHSYGVSLEVGNLLKKGEEMLFSVGGSKDGFETHSSLNLGKHYFYGSYSRLDFEQNFYGNGWESTKGVFNSTQDKNKSGRPVLAQTAGKQEDIIFTYGYKISNLWSAFLTPQYEYYSYQDGVLDGGNHSTLGFALQYNDGFSLVMDMHSLDDLALSKKEAALKDLPHLKTGKAAVISYTAGGDWTGSDYEIQKISAGGAYLWEFKTRHRIAVFAKGIRALKAPFSNQIESSDLLFGMGIYDRQQRGKGGISGGLAFTYFLVRNKDILLGLTPFYEQAYVTSGNDSYRPHSGAGAELTFRWWPIHMPVSINYTQNLSDGDHRFGFKIGRHF